MDHRHVIPINVRWSGKFKAHHSQLIPDAAQSLNALLHGKKISPKNISLDSGLFLVMLIYHGHIHKNHITSTVTTIRLIPGIVGINKHYELNFLNERFGAL